MRNLKALGLALVAILAMSAMAASAAYATEEGHVTAYSSVLEEHVNADVTAEDYEDLVFKKGGSTTTCEEDIFHSTVNETTKKLTVDPTFGGEETGEEGSLCQSGGFPATVIENGCHLDFYTAETDGGTHTWKVTTDVVCPTGTGIQVRVFSGPGHGSEICRVEVLPQTGLQGVTIHSETNTPDAADDLTVTVDVSNITYTQTKLCGHEHGTASMEGALTMTATSGGNPVDLQVNHTEE